MKTFFSQVLSLGLLAALWASILIGINGLITVTVSAYWIVIILGVACGVLVMLLSAQVTITFDPGKKSKMLENLEKAAPKSGNLKRAYNWLVLCLIVVSLAYGGWVFTAVCYAVMGLFVRFCISIGRDTIESNKECATQ